MTVRIMTVVMVYVVICFVYILQKKENVCVEAGVVSGSYDDVVAAADAFLLSDAQKKKQVQAMREYISFESISADETKRDDARACATWLAEHIKTELGMSNARLIETSGNPAVVASSSTSDKPGIVLYGHYDVQPVDPLELWTSGPFDMVHTELDGYGEVFMARGAADNKGGSYGALSGLIGLHSVLSGGLASLPINVIVLIEGMEETSSAGFADFIKSNLDIFDGAELVMNADGGQPRQDVGGMALSLRGNVAAQLDVKGADIDLHSGGYGGSILNPIVALTRLVGSLHDPITGRINIEGFYDDVVVLSPEERAELEEASPLDDNDEAKRLGVGEMIGEVGYTTNERRTIRPSLDILGIYGGYREEGIKTVLPSEAHAKLSFRLVRGQDPDRVVGMLDDHMNKVKPVLAPGIKVTLTPFEGRAPAYSTDRESKGYALAREVLTELYDGKDPIVYRMGGSVPATGIFLEHVGLNSVGMAFGGSDSFAHAPNERFRVSGFQTQMKGYLRWVMKLSEEYGKTTTFDIVSGRDDEEN